MLRFSVVYFLWASALFSLFFFEGYSPLFAINQWQTEFTKLITHYWVQVFDLPVLFHGATLILPNGMNLHIVHECNGLVPFLLYFAAILAYPTHFKYKFIWALLGYSALVVINTIRMFLITLVVLEDKSLFYIAHDWIGRYSVAFLTVGLFFIFTNYVPVINRAKSDLSGR